MGKVFRVCAAALAVVISMSGCAGGSFRKIFPAEVSSNDPVEICRLATATIGQTFKWDDRWAYSNYVGEAKRLGYTPDSCASLISKTVAINAGIAADTLREKITLAKQGNAKAQYNLGAMYETGRDVPHVG